MNDLLDTKDPVLAALDLKFRTAYDRAWKQYAQAVRFPLETSQAQRDDLYKEASRLTQELSVKACEQQAHLDSLLIDAPKPKLKKAA